jgi:hypothetical protein
MGASFLDLGDQNVNDVLEDFLKPTAQELFSPSGSITAGNPN